MSLSSLRKKLDYWRYLGYSKDTLAQYDNKIAGENLRVLSGAAVAASIIILLELAVILILLYTGKSEMLALHQTAVLLTIIAAVNAGVMIANMRLRRNPANILFTRVLTTVFLSCWGFICVFIGAVINPGEPAVLVCAFFC